MCDRPIVKDPKLGTQKPRGISGFIDDIVGALTSSRIYSDGHPRVKASIEALEGELELQMMALGRDRIRIGAAEDYLFFDERPLLGASRSAPRLLEVFARLNAGGLEFDRGAGPHEFLALLRFLADDKSDVKDVETANRLLAHEHCVHLRILPPFAAGGASGTGGGDKAGASDLAARILAAHERSGKDKLDLLNADPAHILDLPLHLHHDIFDHLTETTMRVMSGEMLDLGSTKSLVEQILQRLHLDTKSMLSVAHYATTEADRFLFQHSIRTACVTLNFARHLTNDDDLLLRIGTAALLHDVGKARLDYDVLHFDGEFLPEQRAEMGKHPEYGAEALLELGDGDPLGLAATFGHHRTLDQGGYPSTLHRTELSVATRMIQICDVYEALTAWRPYKAPMSPTRAYRIMMNMEYRFDLPLLNSFIHINGIYPAGTWVELDNGEAGRVEAQTGVLERPVITSERIGVKTPSEVVFTPIDPALRDLRRTRDVSVVEWLGHTTPSVRPRRA